MGEIFTWTNGCVKAKLDRVLINPAWQNLNLACNIEFLTMDCMFDHCPAIIKFLENNRVGNRPFNFFNMWMLHIKFSEILEAIWHKPCMVQCNLSLHQSSRL